MKTLAKEHHKMKPAVIVALGAGVVLTVGILAEEQGDRIAVKPPFGQHAEKGKGTAGTTPQITWHGGPVLNGTSVPLYVVYYGSGFPVKTQDIVNKFLGGLGNTPQFNVNTTYCAFQTTDCTAHSPVSGLLSFADPGSIFIDAGASQGTTIKSAGVAKILQYALSPSTIGHLPPPDDNAMYIVITAPNIKASGFCTSFCAYHTRSTTVVAGHVIHYAFVPEPNSRCTVCDGNFAMGETGTPTGDPGADEMVDSIMHELSETVTDPDLNAWYTSGGAENGDLCNYNYGTPLGHAGNGATYNATWNGYFYLIQLIWKNGPVPQSCAAAP
jgi:hypothetical protein